VTAPEIETLLQELADPAKEPAVSSLTVLSEMGTEELSAFLRIWPDMELASRRRLIEVLAELAEDNVELNFDVILKAALTDSDAVVRQDAVKGLWEHEGKDLIQPLVELLSDDPEPAVRAEAALALGRFVLRAEFGALGASDSERLERALQDKVEDEEEIAEVRARALEAVGARSQPQVRVLIQQGFESEDRRLRLSAVHAMGRSCDPEWLPTLGLETESDDPEMRFEAALACGAIGDPGAMPYLLPLLQDEDNEVQETAINALGQIGGASAKEALEDMLEDAGDRVRDAVRAALDESYEDPLHHTVAE